MERIRCSAPLPEDSADPVLTRMLAPAPHRVPVKEDQAESGKAKGSLHSEGISYTVSGEIKVPPPEDKSEGEVKVSSPQGKKRAAFEDWEEKAPKRGKMPYLGGSGLGDNVVAQFHSKDRPLAKS